MITRKNETHNVCHCTDTLDVTKSCCALPINIVQFQDRQTHFRNGPTAVVWLACMFKKSLLTFAWVGKSDLPSQTLPNSALRQENYKQKAETIVGVCIY